MIKIPRKINVFGIGNNAINFCVHNQNDVEVVAFIEGKKHAVKEFLGKEVVLFEKADCVLKENYTVVASTEDVYWQIKDMLESRGYEEFEDFEYYITFGKKIAIMWGNCHGTAVKNSLMHSAQFCDKYGFYPVKPIQEMAGEGRELGEINKALDRCKLFIHQCVRRDNYFGKEYSSENFMRKLRRDCMIIGIPNLYRMPWCFFPQMPQYGGVQLEGAGYFFEDSFIDDNYKNCSVDELVEMMNDEMLVSTAEIMNEFKQFEDKMCLREKEWDIKISKFIKDSIKDYKLFYDVGHPSEYIINYIVIQLLKIIGVENVSMTDLLSCSSAVLDIYEVPIYECVKRAFNMNFDDRIIRKRGMKLRNVIMDRKEYVQEYIKWTHGKYSSGKIV